MSIITPAYRNQIQVMHRQLGIPEDYERRYGLGLQAEARELVFAGKDVFERDQQVAAEVLQPWEQMRAAAEGDGVVLQLVSAFRSVQKQFDIVKRKLDLGIPIKEILEVSAAPGHSEHHTGRALDLTTVDSEVLEEIFETTAAFAWLQKRAGEFSFRLSYPRDNPSGISYEPWHWAYQN